MYLTSATLTRDQKHLICYISLSFCTDHYDIFRDDSFWVTKSVYHKKKEKYILRMRSVLYLRMRNLKSAKRFEGADFAKKLSRNPLT